MIIKKEVSWNKDYANDGILYFSQRIVEMLDFRTIDIYRAPVSNTPSLIKEYLNVYEGAAKEYNLEEILQETVFSLENDIILLEKFGEDKIREIVKKIHSSKEKEQVLEYASGNEMAAIAIKQIGYDLMGYYPITPSTQIAENLDMMKAKGRSVGADEQFSKPQIGGLIKYIDENV